MSAGFCVAAVSCQHLEITDNDVRKLHATRSCQQPHLTRDPKDYRGGERGKKSKGQSTKAVSLSITSCDTLDVLYSQTESSRYFRWYEPVDGVTVIKLTRLCCVMSWNHSQGDHVTSTSGNRTVVSPDMALVMLLHPTPHGFGACFERNKQGYYNGCNTPLLFFHCRKLDNVTGMGILIRKTGFNLSILNGTVAAPF